MRTISFKTALIVYKCMMFNARHAELIRIYFVFALKGGCIQVQLFEISIKCSIIWEHCDTSCHVLRIIILETSAAEK